MLLLAVLSGVFYAVNLTSSCDVGSLLNANAAREIDFSSQLPLAIQGKFFNRGSEAALSYLKSLEAGAQSKPMYLMGRKHWGRWNSLYPEMTYDPVDLDSIFEKAQALNLNPRLEPRSRHEDFPFYILKVHGTKDRLIEMARDPSIQKIMTSKPSAQDLKILSFHRLPLLYLNSPWQGQSAMSPSQMDVGVKYYIVVQSGLSHVPGSSRLEKMKRVLRRHLSWRNSDVNHQDFRFVSNVRGFSEQADWYVLQVQNTESGKARLQALLADTDFTYNVWVHTRPPQFYLQGGK